VTLRASGRASASAVCRSESRRAGTPATAEGRPGSGGARSDGEAAGALSGAGDEAAATSVGRGSLAGVVLGSAAGLSAQVDTAEASARRLADRTDVRRYDKLVEEYRALDYRYRAAKAQAKNELHRNNGKLSHETATRISDLKDNLGRKRAQLVAIAALTNLPVPDIESLRNETKNVTGADRASGPTIIGRCA